MKAGFAILATLSVLLSAHALAGDLRFGKPEAFAPAAVIATARERAVDTHVRLRDSLRESRTEELSPIAYGPFALVEDGADRGITATTRLYPIASSVVPTSAAAPAAPSSAGKESEESPRHAKKASLPVPGSWAMILAGLLGVGAIARRRMSA